MWLGGVDRGLLLGGVHCALLLILTILPLRSEGTPTHIDGYACVLTDKEDLVKAFDNVKTMLECRELCKGTKDCNFFNYFTAEGSYNLKCYLLRFCDQKAWLKGSEIGTTVKASTCSLPVESTDAQLLRNEFAASELACKDLCREDANCSLYSYFETLNDCQLLHGGATFQAATMDDFHTGPPDCYSESGQCTFALLDSKTTTHTIVQNSGKTTMTLRSGVRHCNVTLQIVVIGKGGRKGRIRDELVGTYSGGGSGYISSATVTVQPNVDIAVYLNHIANGGKNTVAIPAGEGGRIGNIVAWAEKGQSGTEQKGGDGYSGGGYPCKKTSCSNGGMAGGNGTGAHPGMGSKLDVSLFDMPYFNFTAGTFGQGGNGEVMLPPNYNYVQRGIYSGGGGGILVNGKGPIKNFNRPSKSGYGAGEGFVSKWDWGCALFAIVNP